MPSCLQIDPAMWELEVQQVAPKLLIRVAAEARDWRTHLDAASRDKEVLTKAWPPAQTSLLRLRGEVTEHLAKVDTREAFLNGEFAAWTDEYRNKKEVFASKQVEHEKYRNENGEWLAELQKYMDQIEEMQGDLDARSSLRSDAGPTMKVRKAIESLQTEIKQMDVQLGVIRQQLHSTRMKERGMDL